MMRPSTLPYIAQAGPFAQPFTPEQAGAIWGALMLGSRLGGGYQMIAAELPNGAKTLAVRVLTPFPEGVA